MINHFKKQLFIILILIGTCGLSQEKEHRKFKLNWIENVLFSTSYNEKINRSIVEHNFLDNNLNATITESWEVIQGASIGSFTISNPVYETIPSTHYNQFSIDQIPSSMWAQLEIVAIIDNDQSNPIVLNDSSQTDLNNYKKGQVNYSL